MLNDGHCLTLDTELEGRLAHGFTPAVGGAAGVHPGPGVSDGSEYQTHVAKDHSGAYVVHQWYSLRSRGEDEKDASIKLILSIHCAMTKGHEGVVSDYVNPAVCQKTYC